MLSGNKVEPAECEVNRGEPLTELSSETSVRLTATLAAEGNVICKILIAAETIVVR